ncbi:hypothetical protein QA612_02205, partial [Evansella sp. AB-P1]|uniref:hypothetical protein n=1 Tax=Evansella sp. AB-P1 TaxID=3037653 RepID=UPI00241F0980
MRKDLKIRNGHIVLILLIFLLTLCSNSFRQIPKYYKNMGFVSLFNVIYYFLCRRHLVWEFIPTTGAHWPLLRVVHIMIITPLLVLVFLSKLPNTLFKQFIHFIRWVAASTAVEYVVKKNQLILYAHGWNVFWSGILYAKMFLYSLLFTKRPILTLILSLCSTVYFIFKFNVPIKKNHFSRHFEPLLDIYYHTFLED